MNNTIEKVYHKLPVFLQNIVISVFGFLYYYKRFGGVFNSELHACKKRQYFSKQEWDKFQENELRKLLVHSFENVPYYNAVFTSCGFNAEILSQISLHEISKLPILEKSVFRIKGSTEILSRMLDKKGSYLFTSGSSGTPLKIRYSRTMHQKYFAIYESNVRNWAGVKLGDRRGVIGGRRILENGNSNGPFYRYNFFEGQVYFSAYHICIENVSNYIQGMIKHKIDYMEGYASSIYFLAKSIEDAGLQAPQLKAVLTSTDKLTDEMRSTFRRVFKCEAFDSYNGVDICNLISECEYHKLHIVPDVGIVEVVNREGNPCRLGDVGELVSTGLLNLDQPLIRYKIGDLVKLSENQTCKCGREMTIVDEIVGRIEDVVIGPGGKEMRRFNRIFIDIPCVLEGQVIQYEVNKFDIKLVVSHPPSIDNVNIMKERMKAQLGEVDVNVVVVDTIARGPNGKFKAVISYVNQEN